MARQLSCSSSITFARSRYSRRMDSYCIEPPIWANRAASTCSVWWYTGAVMPSALASFRKRSAAARWDSASAMTAGASSRLLSTRAQVCRMGKGSWVSEYLYWQAIHPFSSTGAIMSTRIESDSMGNIDVPADRYWGAQTQRSLQNFAIGQERMPLAVVHALALIKKAAALTNQQLDNLDDELAGLICRAADEVLAGRLDDHFPLSVWQTGSGTQSNMNINEVLANRANEMAGQPLGGKRPVHPNDHVNRGQSSNDTFPSAMHVAAALQVTEQLLPAVTALRDSLDDQARRHAELIKIGRTHLMDATPVTFGQEMSAFVAQLDMGIRALGQSLPDVLALAQGGTAVGTGLNAPLGFATLFADQVASLTGLPFTSAPNKFAALG